MDQSTPLPEWISLSQVVNWLVLGERPMPPVLDKARRIGRYPDWEAWEKKPEAFHEAKFAIFSKLHMGRLEAFGRISRRTTTPDNNWKHRTYVEFDQNFTLIPSEYWTSEGIVWVRGSLLTEDAEYAEIRVQRIDFVEHFAPTESVGLARSPSAYTTPYLDLMFEAIAEQQISEHKQPKHETLVSWFRERSIDGKPISENQAKAMASFVRLPDRATGGLTKQPPNQK